METKKQTAVEWLDIQFKKGVDCNPLDISCHAKAYDNLFDQAKAMEKMQIIEAYEQGESEWTPFEFKTAQDYYTSTYGK
jgi:hypothetical protein